jgi:general secretion pathway protein K
MTAPLTRARSESGVVLLVVLFFVLLLSASIASFASRATIDSMISHNRDASSQAEALARGGVRLAAALLVEDLIREAAEGVPIETSSDPWALVGFQEITTADGSVLRLHIRDIGGRLNLNALPVGEGGEPPEETLLFATGLMEKIVEALPLPPGERALYHPDELAANLIDWLDPDDLRIDGGPEDAYYQEQDPPYRAANRPLLSVDELRLIEGFDGVLVEALRPYVTVYPWAPPEDVGSGINPNTAPTHVLALLFFFDGVSHRFVEEDEVRRILELRQEGRLICGDSSLEACTPISEIVGLNPVFPPPSFASSVFRVVAEASVGEVRRSIEAVMDRSDPVTPRLLSWRVR